jgi:hypothetical protein
MPVRRIETGSREGYTASLVSGDSWRARGGRSSGVVMVLMMTVMVVVIVRVVIIVRVV